MVGLLGGARRHSAPCADLRFLFTTFTFTHVHYMSGPDCRLFNLKFINVPVFGEGHGLIGEFVRFRQAGISRKPDAHGSSDPRALSSTGALSRTGACRSAGDRPVCAAPALERTLDRVQLLRVHAWSWTW